MDAEGLEIYTEATLQAKLNNCVNLTSKWISNPTSVTGEELEDALMFFYFHTKHNYLEIHDDGICYTYNAMQAALDGDRAKAERWVKHYNAATRGKHNVY